MGVRDDLGAVLRGALESLKASLGIEEIPPIIIESPKIKEFGDLSTNIAFGLAKSAKKSPLDIAHLLIQHLQDPLRVTSKIEVKPPGFINFFLSDSYLYETLGRIGRDGINFKDIGKEKKVLLEFVSANPTGPLHIGHGRGAVIGDVLANILASSGFKVEKEYYINDVGYQMKTLGLSVYYRYLELEGKDLEFPKNFYQGDYIRDIAREIKSKNDLPKDSEEELLPFFADKSYNIILEGIKKDLDNFGVIFDNWVHEKDILSKDRLSEVISFFTSKGLVYEESGALWLKSTLFGDDKDRVIIRANGYPTYFASDILYHEKKFERGFDLLIDIWGADHHGYIPRMKAAIEGLGLDKNRFAVILVQFVNLLREGKPLSMSTRSGEFTSLRELMDEVGKDAARYIFLTRRSDVTLDFDLEVAKKKSEENPLFYVQYAFARLANLLNFAQDKGIAVPSFSEIDPAMLQDSAELSLIKDIALFPDIMEDIVRTLEPHRLTIYLYDLAYKFHSYYNKTRMVTEDIPLTKARCYLTLVLKDVIEKGLKLLGVTAPERM